MKNNNSALAGILKLLLVFLCGSITAAETSFLDILKDNDGKKPEKRHFLADEILQKEIIRNSCVLTREETEAAVKIYFEAEKITAENFSSAAAMMRKLTEGLRLVAEKEASPETVYSELNLARYGITEGNWTFYVRRYDTVPKIASLEQWIPDNADVIMKSACTQYKPMMEKFLLEQFVLCDFDAGNPTLTALPESRKTALWWTKRLDDYNLSQKDKEKIILFFERTRTPAKQKESWTLIFEKRLKRLRESMQ